MAEMGGGKRMEEEGRGCLEMIEIGKNAGREGGAASYR